MRRGTGVFMPVYATAVPNSSESKGCESLTHTGGGRTNRSSQTRRDAAQAPFTAPRSMWPLQMHGPNRVRDTTSNTNISSPQLQSLTPLSLQQLPSRPPSTCDSDLNILSAASDASFTSTCSSLLDPTLGIINPFAAYATQQAFAPSHYGSCIHVGGSIQLATQGMASYGSMAAHQPEVLPQLTCQSELAPFSSGLAELLLIDQQEAEVDAAINELVKLKHQLAAANQQPAMGLTHGAAPHQQQHKLVSTATSLSTRAAMAAMIPGASWASSLPGGCCEALDAADVQGRLHQEQALVGLQAEMLQLVSFI